MCLLQMLAAVCVGAMFITDSHTDHPVIFASLIGAVLLTMLFFAVVRRGWHVEFEGITYSRRYSATVELLTNLFAWASFILGIIALGVSFF